LLIPHQHFVIAQKATAQSEKGLVRCCGLAEASPVSMQMNRTKKRKIGTVRPTGLKTGGLQLHHNHENVLFLTVILLLAQCKMRYW
jgi:hypothetical protein